MLSKEDALIMLNIINQTKFVGTDVETVAALKVKLAAIIEGEGE